MSSSDRRPGDEPQIQRVHVYADETGIGGDRYMIIGGIWIPASAIPKLRGKIAAFRVMDRMTREMKWTKIHATKLDEYKRFADLFFDCEEAKFHSIVVDSHILDHGTWSDGDPEVGFYKFHHTLISRRLDEDCDYLIHLDERNNRQADRLPTLKRCLNAWWRKRHFGLDPVRDIQPIDSKAEDIIQIADVLLGALNYAWNVKGTDCAKAEMAQHVQRRSGRALAKQTPRGTKINIWPWRPSSLPAK